MIELDPTTLRNRLLEERRLKLGFPVAYGLVDFAPLAPLSAVLMNNAGDPYAATITGGLNVHDIERDVLEALAPLFVTPGMGWSGFMADGSTSAILHGVRTGRTRCGTLIASPTVYHSAAAHRAVREVCDVLGLRAVELPVDELERIDLPRAMSLIDRREPAVAVATLGTTMRESLDDVAALRALLHEDSYVHVDGALSGLPLALQPQWRHLVQVGPGAADSVSFSGHKACGTPIPSGVFLGRADEQAAMSGELAYLRSRTSTLATSRCGHNVLQLAHVLALGWSTLGDCWAWCRKRAAMVADRLPDAHHWPWGFTVSFPAPRPDLADTYGVMAVGEVGKICVMPGVSDEALHLFLAEMHARDPHVSLIPDWRTSRV